MKIVHIAPNAPYNDYWGYQENILPKYQKKLGHEVIVITTNTMHQDKKIIEIECDDYILNDGIRVIRLVKKKYFHHILTNLNSRLLQIEKYLEKIKPDFIFFHGLVSTTIYDVIRYKKNHPECIVIQDNHLDYNIGSKSKTLKEKIIRAFYRHINKKSISYVERVYGVTPWRKIYAEDYFEIPKEKTDILIMGADDEKIDFKNRDYLKKTIRKEYNISNKDFLIVTGGKIDEKKKIHFLMQACSEIKNVKLLIFGQVHDDIKKQFDTFLKKNKNIIYIGWIAADKVYEYFFAADLVFFPGQHSVLWEQACASKVPCVFERWEGMEHVNNGGNSDFVSPVNSQTLKNKIKELLFTEKYYKMKEIALSSATDIYLYSNIAKKSLECLKK
ncbi:glycosyltransferase family 4 protein [uncultured Fusobacterium sp.]|uniref:glycosyltransferase family 4 protein n=1 Tax=uncultured Fusobacterium sp. TaxID=159267 RepID=UPI0025D5F8F1|nr:glycosyltransferase family 4 protein [uncultured Fusobacterium sp.]